MKETIMKKTLSVTLAFVLLMSVWSFSGISAAAEDQEVCDILTIIEAQPEIAPLLYGIEDYSPQSGKVEDDILDEADALPSAIDLRNYNGKNYVTPVKNQSPFGSCWSFGIAAAAEISYLYDNDLGVPAGEVNDQVDFSEKYITWYLYHAITEQDVVKGSTRASQIGEGYDVSEAESANPTAVYDFGGNSGSAPNFFASGFGPVDEGTVINGEQPYVYRGKNSLRVNDTEESEELAAKRKEYYREYFRKTSMQVLLDKGDIQSEDEYDDWFDSYWHEGSNAYDQSYAESNYAPYDDWSLPLTAEYRTPSVASYFKNSYTLPTPASADATGSYQFNPVGVAAMKKEIANGHGVAIGILADQSLPGQEIGDSGYLNTTNWAQYYDGPLTLNHEVAVVGYDDNYPKENFTRKVNGEIVEGSTPPADGAFIVKNSWGALTEEDKATVTYNKFGSPVYQNPNASSWGIEDTGYFYLSYYDHSILRAYSYEFYSIKDTKYLEMNYDQYDLLQGNMYDNNESDTERKMANIFDAEEDEYLVQISTMTIKPGSTVHYEIYKDVDKDDPTSGTLLEEGDAVKELAGYQRIDLKSHHLLNKGDLYSVVITQTYTTDDDSTKYVETYLSLLENRQSVTVNGVINPGESWCYADGKWTDMAANKDSIIDKTYQNFIRLFGSEEYFLMLYPDGRDSFAVDNYPIKAFSVPVGSYSLEYLLGDSDLNNEVTVLDATAIQRHLAKLDELSSLGEFLADVDLNQEITITDATYIQRWLAHLSCPDGIGVSVLTS